MDLYMLCGIRELNTFLTCLFNLIIINFDMRGCLVTDVLETRTAVVTLRQSLLEKHIRYFLLLQEASHSF